MAKGSGGMRAVNAKLGKLNVYDGRFRTTDVMGSYHSSYFKGVAEDDFKDKATTETVSVSSLRPTQAYVKKKQVEEIMHNTSLLSVESQPIEVVKSEGNFYVLDGHHRVFAAKLLGVKNIKVRLLKI